MTTLGNTQGGFDSKELAQAVKELVTREGLQEDALLKKHLKQLAKRKSTS